MVLTLFDNRQMLRILYTNHKFSFYYRTKIRNFRQWVKLRKIINIKGLSSLRKFRWVANWVGSRGRWRLYRKCWKRIWKLLFCFLQRLIYFFFFIIFILPNLTWRLAFYLRSFMWICRVCLIIWSWRWFEWTI